MSFLTSAYKWGWVTKAQLQAAVVSKKITAADYKQITCEDYEAEGAGT
jgi:uncharacterized XkdX family phage protein